MSPARQGPYPLVRCVGCGALALFPQPDDATLAEAYAPEYYGAGRRKFVGPIAFTFALFQDRRARVVARRVPRGGRILDVGCGDGEFLRRMQKRGYAVEGTEWTAASVARVPAASGIRVHVGDLLDLGLPARTYDAVTLWHVLEHLRRPDAALERIAMLLRPGGWLVLAIPNADGAQARRYGPAWFHHDPPRHLVGLGQAALEPLLAAQGFRIVHLRTSSLEQDLFGEIQSRLNARGFPRDRLYQHLKGLARAPLPTRVGDFARLVLSTPPALARVLADGLRGAGATLTIEARLDPR